MVGAPVSYSGNQPQPPLPAGSNPAMNPHPQIGQAYTSPGATLSTLLPYNGGPSSPFPTATTPPTGSAPPPTGFPPASAPINTNYLYPPNPASTFPQTSAPYSTSSAVQPPPFPPCSTAPPPPYSTPNTYNNPGQPQYNAGSYQAPNAYAQPPPANPAGGFQPNFSQPPPAYTSGAGYGGTPATQAPPNYGAYPAPPPTNPATQAPPYYSAPNPTNPAAAYPPTGPAAAYPPPGGVYPNHNPGVYPPQY